MHVYIYIHVLYKYTCCTHQNLVAEPSAFVFHLPDLTRMFWSAKGDGHAEKPPLTKGNRCHVEVLQLGTVSLCTQLPSFLEACGNQHTTFTCKNSKHSPWLDAKRCPPSQKPRPPKPSLCKVDQSCTCLRFRNNNLKKSWFRPKIYGTPNLGFRKSDSKPLDLAINWQTSCTPHHLQDPAALLPSPCPASRLSHQNPLWGWVKPIFSTKFGSWTSINPSYLANYRSQLGTLPSQVTSRAEAKAPPSGRRRRELKSCGDIFFQVTCTLGRLCWLYFGDFWGEYFDEEGTPWLPEVGTINIYSWLDQK